MKSPHRTLDHALKLGLVSVALGLLPGAFGQSASAAKPKSDAVLTLDPFTVNTSADYGYRKTNAISATRIGTAIIDTPLNIQVIGADFLKDLGVDNIQDAFRYTSGISVDYANEFRPSVRVRGFAPGAIYRDGFLRYYNFDLDGIEQIEIVKGPNAVYFGRTAPGGIINYITKKPQFVNGSTLTATLGDHEYYKALLDSQFTTKDQKLGVRLVGSKLDARSWLDEKTQKKEFLLANATWRPFERLELYAGYEHTDNQFRGTGAYGMVHNAQYEKAKQDGSSPAGETFDTWRRRAFAATGVLPPTYDSPWLPRNYSFNKNGHGSFEEGRDNTVDLQAKLKLAENLHLRLAYNKLRSFANQGFFINGSPDQTPVGEIRTSRPGDGDFNPSGPVLPANNSYTTLNYGFLNVPWFMIFDRPNFPYLQGGNQMNTNKRKTYQADLAYDFTLFKAKHTIVASFDESRDRYYRAFPLVNTTEVIKSGIIPGWAPFFDSSRPMPYSQYINPFSVGFGSPSFGWLPLDVLTLKYSQIPDLKKLFLKWSDQLGADSYFGGNRRVDTGYGVNYNGKYFDEKFNLSAGYRHSITESIAYNEKGDKGTAARTSHNTPMVGATWRVAPGIVAFASYNKSFQVPPSGFEGAKNPVVTNPITGATAGGESLPVEQGQGYDIGLKTDFRENLLSGTISLFRVDRKDVLIRDTQREKALLDSGFTVGSAQFQRASGLQRSEGAEADFIYTPTRNYQALVSFTWTWKREIVNPDPTTINKAHGGTYDSGIPGDTRNQFHQELAGVPEFMASFYNKYTFSEGRLKDFSIGGGVSYESSTWPDPDVNFGFRAKGYYLVDALVSRRCKVADVPVDVSLTVNNVFDKHFYSGRVGIGAPRTWKLNASIRF